MSKENKPKYQDIGGQAVMEGVMMQNPANGTMALAVRRPSGRIVVSCEHKEPLSKKHKWMGWPLVRGCVNMVTMLAMGMQTLDKGTQMLGLLEEEPTKFEKWLAKKLGASVDKIVMAVAMVLAVCLSLFLFVALPTGAATLAGLVFDSRIAINLISGVVRIGILVLYMWAVGFVPDIKRVFMYHGAEHKTVYCNEAGLELTPENARKFSCLHPRCGTAFLFLVMFISILVGSVADQLIYLLFGIEKLGFLLRFGRSILILPLITGISYEALKGLAHAGENVFVRALRWPGLMLQHLTTREPDDKMLEVAIAAMKAAKAGSANWKETLGGDVAEYVDEEHEKAADDALKAEKTEETEEKTQEAAQEENA